MTHAATWRRVADRMKDAAAKIEDSDGEDEARPYYALAAFSEVVAQEFERGDLESIAEVNAVFQALYPDGRDANGITPDRGTAGKL
jgi:hypothetical protein